LRESTFRPTVSVLARHIVSGSNATSSARITAARRNAFQDLVRNTSGVRNPGPRLSPDAMPRHGAEARTLSPLRGWRAWTTASRSGNPAEHRKKKTSRLGGAALCTHGRLGAPTAPSFFPAWEPSVVGGQSSPWKTFPLRMHGLGWRRRWPPGTPWVLKPGGIHAADRPSPLAEICDEVGCLPKVVFPTILTGDFSATVRVGDRRPILHVDKSRSPGPTESGRERSLKGEAGLWQEALAGIGAGKSAVHRCFRRCRSTTVRSKVVVDAIWFQPGPSLCPAAAFAPLPWCPGRCRPNDPSNDTI